MGEDGPYCFLQNSRDNNRWVTQILAGSVNTTENEEEVVTNVLKDPMNDLQFYNQRKQEYEEAFRDLKRE